MRRIILLLISLLALTVQAQPRLPSSITMNHEDEVSGAYWSEDGNTVLSWSQALQDNTVRLWDLEAGSYTSQGEFWERGKYDFTGIHDVGWSPDEQHYWVSVQPVHTCQPRCGYQIWLDGEMLADVNNRAAWNSDSRRIVTWYEGSFPISEDYAPLRVYDTQSRELIGSLSGFHGLREAVWSSNGEEILYLAYNFSEHYDYGQYFVGRWNPQETEPIEEIALSELKGYSVLWRPADTLRDSLIMLYPKYDYAQGDCEQYLCQLSIKFAGEDEFVTFTGDELIGLPPMRAYISPSANWIIGASPHNGEDCDYYDCPAVFLWNRESPIEPVLLEINSYSIKKLVWSPDESRFLVAYVDNELNTCTESYCDGTIKVINSAGETELVFPQENDEFVYLQWNQAGNQFITANNYKGRCELCISELQWLDANTGDILLNLRFEFQRIWQVEWREETNQLAFAVGRLIYIYDLDNLENPLILDGHASGRISFIWREGELLSWSADSTLRYWDLSGETSPYEMGDSIWGIQEYPEEGYTAYRFHRDSVSGFEFNADGSRLLSWSSTDATVAVWDMVGGSEPIILNHFPHEGYERMETVFWVDNSHFLSYSALGIQIWDTEPNASLYDPERLTYDEYRLHFRGERYAIEARDMGILLYEPLQEGLPELRIEHGGDTSVSGLFLHNYEWIITTSFDATKLWNIQDVSNPVLLGEAPISLDLHYGAKLSPDEQYLVWRDESVHVHELPSLEEIYTLDGVGEGEAEWDATGQRIIFQTNSNELWIAYPFEEREPLVLQAEHPIYYFRWLEAENYLISVEELERELPHLIRIWDAQSGEELRQIPIDMRPYEIIWEHEKLIIVPLQGHELYVYDGLWDENPLILPQNRDISAVLLSEDGRQLVVGEGHYMYSDAIAEIRVWDLPRLLETAARD